MRCRIFLHHLLTLIVVIVRGQEQNNSVHDGNLTNTKGDESSNSTSRPTPSLPPSLSPSPSPTEAWWATSKPTSTRNPTSISPTDIDESYLLIRPLHNIEVSLFGPLNSMEQEHLSVVLRPLLEQALYHAMVDSFIPESMDTTNNATNGEISELSILSKVFLEWVATNSTVAAEDKIHNSTMANDTSTTANSTNGTSKEDLLIMHIFQAKGSLGFQQFDYALLHPQTIFSLQDTLLRNTSETLPRLLEEIQDALRLKGFTSLEVLELETLETGEMPTPSPTIWWLWDDDDEIDTNAHNAGDDESTALNVDDDAWYDGNDNSDDGLGRAKKRKQQPRNRAASQESIATAATVAVVLSAVVFTLFAMFVWKKTQQIKQDLSVKMQQCSKNKDTVEECNDDDSDKEDDATRKVPPITTTSMFSGSSSVLLGLSTKSTSSCSWEIQSV